MQTYWEGEGGGGANRVWDSKIVNTWAIIQNNILSFE